MSRLILNEQASAPATPSAGKVAVYVDNTATPRLRLVDDTGAVYTQLDSNHNPWCLTNASVSTVSAGYAADTYLAGSSITIPAAGLWKVGTIYRVRFDMVKTGAGTAAFTTTLRMGTLGTTGDASVLALAFAVGTAAIDTGIFELVYTFRTVGSGTAAVVQGRAHCTHHLAATGLITTGASGTGIILGTSSGFNSTTQTVIGVSVNGGSSFSGTCTQVQAELFNLNV